MFQRVLSNIVTIKLCTNVSCVYVRRLVVIQYFQYINAVCWRQDFIVFLFIHLFIWYDNWCFDFQDKVHDEYIFNFFFIIIITSKCLLITLTVKHRFTQSIIGFFLVLPFSVFLIVLAILYYRFFRLFFFLLYYIFIHHIYNIIITYISTECFKFSFQTFDHFPSSIFSFASTKIWNTVFCHIWI